ncbi:MAG: hypothetical protein JSV91_00465 [Phycisphaerales bacterium]|nr:MAG: hypothetical protein JSV91_00465 [Phycisphaerales bacterium]
MAQSKTGSRILAAFFALGAAIIILYATGLWPGLFALFGLEEGFGETTKAHPFIMGFIKLFFLGTLGEFIKFRIARGSLDLDKVFQRAVVWGIWGLWFALAFPAFAAAVTALVQAEPQLWPGRIGTDEDPLNFGEKLWLAFSMSLWINVLGMYALGMMVTHEYFNRLIATGWRSWSLNAFADHSQPRFVLSFLPKTLLFWIPAHTFTFAMPGEWRVFIAALLAIALGFFLSVGRRS